ncbi:MAG: TetR family transcriptional regulator C-terminal domain-containing protein [Geobacteraceae bacterium]|nr:TetR family transcriptional regulator C-terminal domain-containing protein [Geobacteraceae bacterium]
MATKDTRSEIIRAGMGIIARHGYNSTGIEAILKQAGVPKGSFYHYFSSKQEFGLQVLDHFASGIEKIFSTMLSDASLSPLARLRKCVEGLVTRFEDNNCGVGCLVANLGQELADQNEEFRQRLAWIFRSWMRLFEQCLREARSAGEIPAESSPELLAEVFISGFEGALLVSKVMKSSAPLRNFIDFYFEKAVR